MANNRTVWDIIRPPVEDLGGTSVEDPYAHLERFLSICDTFKVNGVISDAVRLHLFPFFLQGEAIEWLDDLPAGSITTWDQLVQTFLNKYFPPTKMAKLFSDIISFRQKEAESTHTFYKGADQSVRSMLDAAANGSLFRKTPAEAWEIIGNMVESNIGWPDAKMEKKAGVLEVNALTSSANQVQVQQPDEQQVFEFDAANFMGNQGRQQYNPYNNTYNPGWKNHPNFSWKSVDPIANTSKPVEKKTSFEEIMMKYVTGTETRLQNQEAMLQKLETQMAQIATQLSTRPTGSLLSNTEPNPRGVNAIMVMS
ncbi:uncharacterized protein [Henckelia pumila]|uniref:uncharacterized protein n=1 Tax=Henckelia pumila TaxID=405737 RepID=UPI003C6E7AD5